MDDGFWATHEEQGDRAMLDVHVGKALEITHEERRQLEEYARLMMLTAKDGRAGWLLKYSNAHRGAHQIFRRIIERAHT